MLAKADLTRDGVRNWPHKGRRGDDHYYVYAIVCSQNNKRYVGCTHNPRKRAWEHISELKRNAHVVEDLQTDFNKYGQNAFHIELLGKYYGGVAQTTYERDWMDYFMSYIRARGYNYRDSICTKRKEIIANYGR